MLEFLYPKKEVSTLSTSPAFLARQQLARLTEVKAVDHIPTGSNFLIIVFETSSVYIPGDERSRTYPGHGYPAHTETVNRQRLYVTQDETTFKSALEALYRENPHRQDVAGVKILNRASIKTSVQVDL